VYVEHEPSQQRNKRKAYSDRSTLPDHLLQNSYLHNTTPSEVSNRTDRKPVTDAKTPSIKQEAHRIQYRIPRSTKTRKNQTLVDILQNKSILHEQRYHSTNTAPRPITNNMRRNSPKFRHEPTFRNKVLRNETPSEIPIQKELCHVC